MTRHGRWWAVSAVATLVGFPTTGRADEFDGIDGRVLKRTLADPAPPPIRRLTIGEIAARPALLRDTRSALVLGKTGSGNLARMLVVPELRKPAGGQGEPIPVVILERADSFDAGDPGTRLAHARDLVLYDGFRVDLDTGHIVPEGQGEDVVFTVAGDGGPRLEAVGSATLVAPDHAPKANTGPTTRLSPGRTVVASDFTGRYHLHANGQWSGTLDLQVDPAGTATGRFASDVHGATYPVTGQVAADRPGLIRFAVGVPRTRLEFEGYLFAEGKGAIAGTVALLDRTFGFFAVRDGGRVSPSGVDAAPLTLDDADEVPHRHTVRWNGAEIQIDGKPVAAGGLAVAFQAIADAEPDAAVVIAAGPGQSFSAVSEAVAAVRKAGITSVRLATDAPAP